jgi:hypothetical protein
MKSSHIWLHITLFIVSEVVEGYKVSAQPKSTADTGDEFVQSSKLKVQG